MSESAKTNQPSCFKTTIQHRAYVLAGTTFLIFECIFLEFYADSFWLNHSIAWLGIPLIFLAAFAAFILLNLLESNIVCRILQPIFAGKPPLVFRRWASLHQDGISFGTRFVLFEAIDELELNFWGTLLICSRTICGEQQKLSDVVMKVPLGVISSSDRQRFFQEIEHHCPQVKMNARLRKKLTPKTEGRFNLNLVQAAGPVFMCLLLLDLGFASFYFLEILKEYYWSQKEGLVEKTSFGKKHLERADKMLKHPPYPSWVLSRFLSSSSSSAQLHESRADALSALHMDKEAWQESQEAVALSPHAFRRQLRLARMAEKCGNTDKALKAISSAIEEKDGSLLPRLYRLALLKGRNPDMVKQTFRNDVGELTAQVLKEPPDWPPGGGMFFHDIFYRDDLLFVFGRLLQENISLPESASLAKAAKSSKE